MPSFLKRLTIKLLDYSIRVVLARLAAIQNVEPRTTADTHSAASTASADVTSGMNDPGWRTLHVLPLIYPAATNSALPAAAYPKYFLITSQGLAASAWLASSLNLHPDITCSMGIDHPLISMRFYYNDELVSKKTEGITDVGPIQNGFYSDSLRTLFKDRFAATGAPLGTTLERPNPVRELQRMYDELEWFAQSKFYGNVHSCFASQALEYLHETPARRDILLVNLIRHPIPRTDAAVRALMSIATLAQDSGWHDGISEGVNAIADTQADRRREIEQRFGVDFTDVRNRAVLYSYCRALHNDCWTGEITAVRDACHTPIERLMNDRDYYSWFLSEISRREIAASPEYLDKVFSDQHLRSGRHVGKGRSTSPREQYQSWSDWERDEFKQVLSRLDLANVYAPFGYDFSFVN